MSVFAGIYAINQCKPIERKYIFQMKDALRCTDEEIKIFISKYFVLLKFDFGAFKEPCFISDKIGIAALAGEPILVLDNKENYSRYADLAIIKKHLCQFNVNILNSCNGTYSICNYSLYGHHLLLATDKLGARPLYYYVDKNYVYFSNCLKLFENNINIPKRMDLRAFVEQYVFGVPLGTKTLYSDIKILRDGQYLQIDKEGIQISYYFRWDHLPVHDKNIDIISYENFNAFTSAIKSRCKRDAQIFSFLSGGLDSRCIVAVLNMLQKRVIGMNCSRYGEQDQEFAKQYADRIGIKFITVPRSPDVDSTAKLFKNAIMNTNNQMKNVEYPKTVFSGDGGSVGVGFVYMDEILFNFLRVGNKKSAFSYFLKHWGRISQKIVQPNIWTYLHRIPIEGLNAEFEDIIVGNLERSIYLFLLRNDQRCHMHGYYEQIDQQRVELLIPFYDARLLEIIASTSNLRPFLYHQFYHKWLQLFPDETSSVSWQTYPGHLPCPIISEKEILSQWETNLKYQFRSTIPLLTKCWRILGKHKFPNGIIRRSIFFSALLLHTLRLGNYSYILKFCAALYEHNIKCSSICYENDN